MDDVHHISVFIERPPSEVYEFASDPCNLPRWAAGLARSAVTPEGSRWVVDAPFGSAVRPDLTEFAELDEWLDERNQ